MNSSGTPDRADIRDFLTTRRARVRPERVGLPAGGTQRRVPGLRREEVAVLVGVSADWYIRLEKGHIKGVSDEVLSAVARALLLDDAETAHLFHLARAAKPAHASRRRSPTRLPESIQQLLDAMTGAAAFIRNGRLDIVAANALGRALYAPVLDEPAWKGNIARFNFLDERAATYFPDFAGSMDTTVALLRTEAGRDPYSRVSLSWSANSPLAVKISISAGVPMMSATTTPGSSISTTPSSAPWTSRTTPSTSGPPETNDSSLPATPPLPGARLTTSSACSPAGLRRRTPTDDSRAALPCLPGPLSQKIIQPVPRSDTDHRAPLHSAGGKPCMRATQAACNE